MNLEQVKQALEDESKYLTTSVYHPKGTTQLQFYGWTLTLHADGTWTAEDTSGG